jgi:hypothetical protein
MLDWDLPLSEQPEGIRSAVGDLADQGLLGKAKISIEKGNLQGGYGVEKTPQGFAPVADGEIVSINGRDDLVFPSFEEAFNHIKPDIAGDISGISTGGDAYRGLVRKYGEDGTGQAQASNLLRDKGIKGIQYNDAMSRGMDGGSRTRNYVTFDDKLMNIVDKYGVAGLSAGALGGTLYTPEQNQAMASAMSRYQDQGSITPDEFPVAHQAADWLDRNITTPIPLMERPLEGVSNYLRALGTDRTKAKKTKPTKKEAKSCK